MATTGSTFGPFHIDLVEWRLLCDGVPVVVQDKALQFIAALLERPGGLWTREELFERLWPGVFVSDDALFQAARKARQALGDDPRRPRWIETVQGRGYRFLGAPGPAPAAMTAPAPPPVVRDAPTRGVPCRAPDVAVVGREAELSAIRAFFSDGAPLVTLLGPAGAGKTTLARVEGASRGDAARFVDLLEATDVDSVLHAVGEGLGADSGGPAGRAAVLRAMPTGPEALVVLDNAELCMRALAGLIQEWLGQAPGVRFLVTSRRPLELGAERVVAVGPLPAPAAARVFHARAAARGVVLKEQDRSLVDDVVAAVDGLPLALELAASRVGLLGLGGLLDRLREPLDVLRSNRMDLPERHRSIRAALELSYNALDPVERAFLAGVCVFRGPFRVEEAEAVVGGAPGRPAIDLVAAVVDASLVRPVDDAGGRRRLAPYVAVRELASELGDPTALLAVRHRHLDWLARLSDALGPAQEPSPGTHPTLAPLLEDAVVALRFGVAQERTIDAARVAAWLVPVLARRGMGLRALELLDALGPPETLPVAAELNVRTLRALVVARGTQPEQAPALFEAAADRAAALGQHAAERAALLHWADSTVGRDVAATRAVLARARAALKQAPDPVADAALSGLEAVVRFHDGQTEAAWVSSRASLSALRRLDAGWWFALTLIQHAEFAYLEHRYDEAETWVRRALEVYEAADAPATIDFALTFVGVIRQAQGRLDEALALFLPLRDRARRAGDVQREQHLVYSIGGTYGMLGRLEEATEAFEASLTLTRQQRNRVHEGWVLMRLAGSAWRLGRMATAHDRCLQAIACFTSAGRPILAEAARTELGRIALLVGDLAAAEASLSLACETLDRLERSRARAALAEAMWAEARGRGGDSGARASARGAVAHLRAAWPDEGLARALVSLGMIAHHEGDEDEARRCHAEAEAIRVRVGDTDGDIARDVRRLGTALRAQ